MNDKKIMIELENHTVRFCIKRKDLKNSIKDIKDEAKKKFLELLKKDLRKKVIICNENLENEIFDKIVENYEMKFSAKTCFSYWINEDEVFVDEKEIYEFCENKGYIYVVKENGNIDIFDVFIEDYIMELRHSENEYLSIEVNYKPVCDRKIALYI